MWTRANRDDPVPSLALPRVIEDRHGSWRLRYLAESTDIRQGSGHAPLGQASILGAVGPIEPTGVVVRRRIPSPRGKRARLALGTGVGRRASARFFARVGRLHERQL